MRAFHYPGNIYVFTGPSGAGKSTLLKRLVGEDERLLFSVSHTTRGPREGERDGVDYFFIDTDRFHDLVGEHAFFEYAKVHDNYYGTSKQHIIDCLDADRDVVLDIDVEGARQIKELLPSACTIFILPPSSQSLRDRLVSRGKDALDVIERRLDNAAGEIAHVNSFDFAVVNDDLDQCYQELQHIIAADRLRPWRRKETLVPVLESFQR
jgi:guanylate kinase